jgi:MoxR-like ATPase
MKQKNEMNSLQIKDLLNYFIKNNIKLAEGGKVPIAIEIEGLPGTAKTSVVKQISKEFDFHFVRLNLSEIEVPDLIGLPIYEYKIKNENEEKWVSDKVLSQFIQLGYTALNESRTSYAKPSWIQGKEDKPIILTLDDFNRTKK